MNEIQKLLIRIDEKKKKLDSLRPLPIELVKNLEAWVFTPFFIVFQNGDSVEE